MGYAQVFVTGLRGYDAAKKVAVHPANVQDRDGAGLVIRAIHDLVPWLRHLFADSVCNGPNLCAALGKFGN